MSLPVRADVRLFGEKGYPFIAPEVTDLLTRAHKVMETEPDPVAVGLEMADALAVAAQAIRDLAADVYMDQLSQSPARTSAEWDARGACHDCGHHRATHCNVDGFSYCDTHYPEGSR